MVYLRLFHASLPVGVVEKRQRLVERLLVIVQHICKRSSLTILKELFTANGDSDHIVELLASLLKTDKTDIQDLYLQKLYLRFSPGSSRLLTYFPDSASRSAMGGWLWSRMTSIGFGSMSALLSLASLVNAER